MRTQDTATLAAAPDKKHEKWLHVGNTCRRTGQKTQKMTTLWQHLSQRQAKKHENGYTLATLVPPRGRFCSNPHKNIIIILPY